MGGGIVGAVVALFGALLKIPSLTDKDAVKAWLSSMVDPAAELIALLCGKKVSGEQVDTETALAAAADELNVGVVDIASLFAAFQTIMAIIKAIRDRKSKTDDTTPAVV